MKTVFKWVGGTVLVLALLALAIFALFDSLRKPVDDAINDAINNNQQQEETTDDTNNEENKVVTKKAKSEPKKKTIPKTDDKSVEKTNEYECIRYMPAEAMNALRAVFPYSLSKTELLLTAIYIITNGGIDVPEKVIKAAKTYKDDKLTAIEERLSRIERINNIALNRMYAVELCSSYIVYDMIYGLRGARSGPEKEVFRTMGNLNCLSASENRLKSSRRMMR